MLDGKRLLWPGYGTGDGKTLLGPFHLVAVDGDPRDEENWRVSKPFGGELPGVNTFGAVQMVQESIQAAWGIGIFLRPLGMNTITQSANTGIAVELPGDLPQATPVAFDDGVGFAIATTSETPPWVFDGTQWSETTSIAPTPNGYIETATRCAAAPNFMINANDGRYRLSCDGAGDNCVANLLPVSTATSGLYGFASDNSGATVAVGSDGGPLALWSIDLCDVAPSLEPIGMSGSLPGFINFASVFGIKMTRISDTPEGKTRIAFVDGYSDDGRIRVFVFEDNDTEYVVSEPSAEGTPPTSDIVQRSHLG